MIVVGVVGCGRISQKHFPALCELENVKVKYAMEHGVNVLSEKPMDISLDAAEKAVRTAGKTGRIYGVVSQCRYNDSSILVKQAIESGKVGKILSASSVLT